MEPQALAPAPASAGAGALASKKRRRFSVLTSRDKTLLAVMVGVPLFIFVLLIWVMTAVSVILSFTDWDGVQAIRFVGIDNYTQLFTTYPFFWPAVAHNVMWLLFFVCIATPIGMLLAILLDRPLRGSSVYQSIFFTPVVLSLAVNSALVGTGLVNANNTTDWLGDSSINIWAVLVAASWRHIGYIMVLYLSGLKSVDPSLREAAAIDGANERQTFIHVVFPVMAPINVVIVVVTVIESLRAFDIAYVINHGKNGLELLSILITNNALSEASLIGFGSAIAVVLLTISLVPIVLYLTRVMRSEDQ
jgi:ABC-type sugar transport system permease subunit